MNAPPSVRRSGKWSVGEMHMEEHDDVEEKPERGRIQEVECKLQVRVYTTISHESRIVSGESSRTRRTYPFRRFSDSECRSTQKSA